MREIEIKVAVKDHDVLETALNKLGVKLGPPKKQHDVVFCLPGSGDDALNANWLRIRTENDTIHTFNLKRSVTGQLDSIEHETEVKNRSELEEIIHLLGYVLYSDITKERRTAKYNDIEICFDYVPSLGYFIEAEKIMGKDADHDKVVAELWELFDQLGLDKKDEVTLGYDVLDRRKRGITN